MNTTKENMESKMTSEKVILKKGAWHNSTETIFDRADGIIKNHPFNPHLQLLYTRTENPSIFEFKGVVQ